MIADALREVSGDAVELVILRTRGDDITDRPLAEVGGKGLFTLELEQAMLDGRIDLAVHSLKDLPTQQPEGLVLGAVPVREDPRDAVVGGDLLGLPVGAVVGTGSKRRQAQLRVARPDLELRDIRGNVDTRVRKQREGQFDAVILAAAGLNRLGRSADVDQLLEPLVMVPAPGQGALAVQCRADDAPLRALLQRLHDPVTALEVEAERVWLDEAGGGCTTPTACLVQIAGDTARIRGFHAFDDGAYARVDEQVATADVVVTARRLAAEVVRRGGASAPAE